jgi:hypothetical protein
LVGCADVSQSSAGVNLAFLVVFALMDGIFGGFGVALYAECALIPLLLGLVAAQGAFFGRRIRIAGLADAERGSADAGEAAAFARSRRDLQMMSLRVSCVKLAVSAAVATLATNV